MTVMADVWDEEVRGSGELCWQFGLGGTLPLPAIRHCMAAWLVGVADAVIGDLQLVVTELVTNAYEHGRMPGQIRITRPSTDVVRVEVDDRSRTLPEVQEVFGTTSARGRGMALVTALADRWGVTHTRSGKTVWAEVACAE